MNKLCDHYDPSIEPCRFYIKRPEDARGACLRNDMFICPYYILAYGVPMLSYSAITSWMNCREKFRLAHIVGVELKEQFMPAPMILGKLAARILRHLHDSKNSPDFRLNVSGYIAEKLGVNTMVDQLYLHTLATVFEAYQDLELHVAKGEPEQRVIWSEPDYPNIKMFIDLGVYNSDAKKGFVEYKYTGKPDRYQKIFVLRNQLGTYFLSDFEFEFCILRTIRNPNPHNPAKGGIKINKQEKENPELFFKRLRQDIIRRPKFYFTDKKYWSTQFDLQGQKEKYKVIAKEIEDCVANNAFYPAEDANVCFRGESVCEFMAICETGGISEELYRYKKNKT